MGEGGGIGGKVEWVKVVGRKGFFELEVFDAEYFFLLFRLDYILLKFPWTKHLFIFHLREQQVQKSPASHIYCTCIFQFII